MKSVLLTSLVVFARAANQCAWIAEGALRTAQAARVYGLMRVLVVEAEILAGQRRN